ncbi:MAG: hypothetical protein GQ534_07110 [Candidatus Delongbacteria bacterium]|nr:hypothetical protein [Candidatus Delongbacteria bacterium]
MTHENTVDIKKGIEQLKADVRTGFQDIGQGEKNRFDVGLYNELIELLSDSGVVKFLKEQDFNGSFLHDYIEPLIKFVILWDNPEHEFIDPDIEQKRVELLKSAKRLANKIANKTSYINASVQSVKPRHLLSGPMPDWVKRDAEEINQVADDFVEKYDEFVRFAKIKLYS